MINHLTPGPRSNNLEELEEIQPQGDSMVVKKSKVSARHERALSLMKELRALRAAKGWTQEELAQNMKIPGVTVTRWDRGATTPTSETTLDAVEKFLRRHRPKE
jgi:ribosome-binding protein aMBF1 (putative translation factor)